MLVNEISHVLLGESTWVGVRAALVRLAGCNLRCRCCDTKYAYDEGEEIAIRDILDAVRKWRPQHVLVTGGEPLCQPETPALLDAFLGDGLNVLLETNGSLDIGGMPGGVIRVMDFKCPSSGYSDANLFDNIPHLKPHDNVKFVIADRNDFEWARGVVDCYRLDAICPVMFSPVYGALEPAQLAEWILEERLDVRLQLQQHKVIWGPDKRGV